MVISKGDNTLFNFQKKEIFFFVENLWNLCFYINVWNIVVFFFNFPYWNTSFLRRHWAKWLWRTDEDVERTCHHSMVPLLLAIAILFIVFLHSLTKMLFCQVSEHKSCCLCWFWNVQIETFVRNKSSAPVEHWRISLSHLVLFQRSLQSSWKFLLLTPLLLLLMIVFNWNWNLFFFFF